jgi:glycosyltransferase involved in cell wall biosynthesis
LKHFDIILITFQGLSSDARTLNFASTFLKLGKSICVISLEESIDIKYSFENITIKVDGERAFTRMNSFYKKIKKLKKEISADLIFADDFFSLKPANYLASKNSEVIYDSREIYSEIASLTNSFFRQQLQSFLEKKWIKRIKKVIVTGKADKDYLSQHFKKGKKYFIIPNYPPFKDKIESNFLRDRFNITQGYIIIYQGMLSEGRGIEKLCKAMKLLPASSLCLAGDGALKDRIIEFIETNNLQNQIFLTGLVPYEKLHEITCSADLGISFIQPISYSYQLALPNKMFEYAMANIPVLVSDLPQMKAIIEKYNTGIAISPESSSEEIARAINTLLHNKADYSENCKKASQELCWESNEKLIKEIIFK